jgi:RNA polymerase sigma-70 factor (ECF subfamily)
MPGPQVTEAEFDTTFDRYWLPVFRFALAWTNDWAAAEDLTQDAFLKLWDRRDRVDWGTSVLPWLLTTTHRLATDRFRRLRTAMRATPRRGSGDGSMDSDARLRWLDLQPSLARLSPTQRGALVLTAVVGLTTEQAAGALGISAGAVRAAVSRARANLGDE